jgi:hypothetical protein
VHPATFAIRAGGRTLTFIQAVVLARVLGVEEYGVYAFAIAWAILLGPRPWPGMDRLVVRKVAVLRDTWRA